MTKNLLLLSFLLLFSCGRRQTHEQDQDLKAKIEEKVLSIQSKVQSCYVDGIEHPGRPDCNLDDYSSGPGGFGCLAGNKQACYTMSLILDETGKPYRSYKNRFQKDSKNEFSRDQLYGVAAYLVATKDRNFAINLMSYIENTGRLCDYASDTRCELTPVSWGLLRKVWKNLGLSETPTMKVNNAVDDLFVYTQMKTVETGYQLGLQMQFVFLSQEMGQDNNLLHEAARVGFNRQKTNPFFCYIYEGASNKCMQLYLDWFKHETPGGNMTQWTFARDENEEQAKLDSMGWDALFLGSLLLR